MSLEAVAALLRAGRRFLLATHRGPDADGGGSMIGCAELLAALGKRSRLFLPEGPPSSLADLARGLDVATSIAPEARFDATLVFDCGDRRLLGDGFPPPEVAGTLVVVDHHLVARPYGELEWRDPTEAAVGMMVHRLGERLGVTPSPRAAEALYFALAADTGTFRYSNTTREVLEVAARLVSLGASPARVAHALYEEVPREGFALLQRARLEVSLEGAFATVALDEADLAATGASWDMAEGLVNHARALRGVRVGAQLSSRAGKGTRVSLRSHGDVDVGRVAAAFGGGGHRPAAGCTLDTQDLAAARALLEPVVAEALARADAERAGA